jgi:uncharacterized protein
MLFVDTSFWVAFRNAKDPHHAESVSLLEHHARTSLVTTNHVRGETWTFLRRRAGHQAAVDFLDALAASPRVTVTRVPSDQEQAALAWLRQHDEREYSYVDATSFMVMHQLRISHALAFDGDYSAAGFVELRH